MIAAIMQPYFFPYLGYFQLMHSVDVFVIYDDVQYSKNGWTNRNRIRRGESAAWLTLPVHKAPLASLISERRYVLEGDGVAGVKRLVDESYGAAAAYAEVMPALAALLDFDDANVAAFNANALTSLARRLGARCRFVLSSEIEKEPGLRSQERVIDICRRVGASDYVNSIGGTTLYDAAAFASAGVRLSFLRTTLAQERLGEGPSYLSVIDSLMMYGFENCRERMRQCELLDPAAAAAVA